MVGSDYQLLTADGSLCLGCRFRLKVAQGIRFSGLNIVFVHADVCTSSAELYTCFALAVLSFYFSFMSPHWGSSFRLFLLNESVSTRDNGGTLFETDTQKLKYLGVFLTHGYETSLYTGT